MLWFKLYTQKLIIVRYDVVPTSSSYGRNDALTIAVLVVDNGPYSDIKVYHAWKNKLHKEIHLEANKK